MKLIRSYIIFIEAVLVLMVCALRADAQVTSLDLVNALDIDATVVSHSLAAEVDNGTKLAVDAGMFASGDPLQSSILLSTGNTADEGKGSSAYLKDNATDLIRFSIHLGVPSGKNLWSLPRSS